MNLTDSPMIMALGWTLLHFLWQGLAIAAAIAALLFCFRNLRATSRYLICLGGLVLMPAAALVTFRIMLLSPTPSLIGLGERLLPAAFQTRDFWSPILPWVSLCWFAGTLLLQTRLILHWTRARYLKCHGIQAPPPGWQNKIKNLGRRLDLDRPVRLFTSSLANVPLVMGWLKPVILVPASAFSGLTPAQLETILLHELAHVRRHDYLINLAQSFIETLLFFHPAVWWLSHRIRVEREYICDDVAVHLSRDPLGYARALSSLEGLRDEACQASLASSGGPLMKRIFRIVGVQSRPAQRLGGWPAPFLVALTLMMAVAALSFTPGIAQEIKKVKKIEVVTSPTYEQQVKEDCLKVETIMKELSLKRDAILKELQANGAPENKLKAALSELDAKKSHLSAKMKDLQAQVVLIKKMQAKGLTDQEIKSALFKNEPAVASQAMDSKKVMEAKIKAMKAKGTSDDEIKRFVMEWKKKETAQAEHKQKVEQQAQELISIMKKKGLSDEVIMKKLAAFYEKNGISVKVKIDEEGLKIKKLDG